MMLTVTVAGSIWLFMHLRFHGLFSFMRMEEMLYPFDEKGGMPANVMLRLANWLTQFYIDPMLAVLIPTVALVLLGIIGWLWLRTLSRRCITAIALAFIPVMAVLPWTLSDNFPVDATVTEAWTSWAVGMSVATALALIMRLKPISRYDIFIAPIAFAAVIAWAYAGLPDPDEKMPQLRKEQIATLERLGRWQQLEAMLTQSKPQDNQELTYLNLALAEQGKLADTMFRHEQHGVEGIFCQDDGSYNICVMFSDLFYLTGYLSRAEGNAMDAKQIGVPRHLRRLVEIHTLRGEHSLADKYLDVLSRLRNHRQWAEDMRAGKVRLTVPIHADSLHLTSTTKTLDVWATQLTAPHPNRAAAEYLGAVYLLDRDLHSFRSFYLAWQANKALGRMPRHFQEAAAIIARNDAAFKALAHIDDEILNGYTSPGTYWEYYNATSI